jgi:hypothetical protein
MAVYMVTWDLNSPGQDYTPLIRAVEGFTHCKALKSAYFIDTTRDAASVRDALMKLIDSNDMLFVMRVANQWGANRHTAATNWLSDSARNF